MNLIIFDIDGTLTQTNQIDSTCFTQAISDTLDINNINTDWSTYQFSTDSGLMKAIIASAFQREALADELNAVQNCFIDYLKREYEKNKDLFQPIDGAKVIFNEIKKLSNFHIGVATGGWEKSAIFKLNAAKISHSSIPKAYADDHIERTEIIKIAIKRAQSLNHIHHYERTIYVGDRLWDQRAATNLGIEFIGIGFEFLDQLKGLFIRNYKTDLKLFLDYLMN